VKVTNIKQVYITNKPHLLHIANISPCFG